MKIYVITEGDYEDYHICAVTEDKTRAEKLKNIFDGEIEEYDTEKYSLIADDGYGVVYCCLNEGDNQIYVDFARAIKYFVDIAIQGDITYDKQRGWYYGYILAKTEEQAKEIFYQKLEEYKEKNKNAI